MRLPVAIPLALLMLIVGFAAGYLLSGNKEQDTPSETTRIVYIKSDEAVSDVEIGSSESILDLVIEEGETPSMSTLTQIYGSANGMSTKEIAKALEALQEQKSTSSQYLIRSALIRAWVEKDPEGAFQFALKMEKEDGRNNYIYSVVQYWAEKDFDAAEAAVERIESRSQRKNAERNLLNVLSDQDPVLAYEKYKQLDDSQHYTLGKIFTNWTKQNPDEAWYTLQAIENIREKQAAMQAYFKQISKDDPQEASEYAMRTLTGEDLSTSLSGIAENWLSEDTQGFLNYLSQLQDKEVKEKLIQRTSWNLSREMDSTELLNWALANTEGRSLQTLSSRALGEMAKENPQGALQLAYQNLKGRDLTRTLSQVVQGWVHNDSKAAMEFVSSIDNLQVRNEIGQNMTWTLSEKDPETGFYWALENTSSYQRDNLASRMLQKIAESDPNRAVLMLDQLPYGNAYQNSLGNLAREWTKQDPQGAIQWIYTLPEGPDRDRAFNQFSSAYARKDPEAALSYAQQFPPGEQRTKLIREVAEVKAEENPVAALQWATTLPDEKLQQDVLASALQHWSRYDAMGAISYLQTNLQIDITDGTYSNLARTFARVDPAAAANWSLTLKEDVQKRVIDNVTDQWLRDDMYTASVWIADLPESPAKQEALENLVQRVYQVEPDAAFDWALALKSESRRKDLTRRSVSEWKKRDPQSAWNAVANSSLGEEEKKTLLKLFEE